MDYERIREGMAREIPFNTHIGIEIVDVGDAVGEARLPFDQQITNHVKLAHASAIFAVAEAASGGAMSGIFASIIEDIRPIATGATIRYLRIARAELIAIANTIEEPDNLRSRLEQSGKIDLSIDVTVSSPRGDTIAEITVTWQVALRNRARPD